MLLSEEYYNFPSSELNTMLGLTYTTEHSGHGDVWFSDIQAAVSMPTRLWGCYS